MCPIRRGRRSRRLRSGRRSGRSVADHDVWQRTMRVLLPLVCAILFSGCVSIGTPVVKWPAGEPYVRIERWELAGGFGYACVVTGNTISVRTLNDFSKPSKVLFQRRQSFSEIRSVASAVQDSRMLDHLGAFRRAPPQEEVIVLSDGRLDRFSFREPNPTPVREASVEYHNYSDAAARRVFESVDRLLPAEYRFLKGPDR